MKRLQTAFGVVTSAPLSEHSQRITQPVADSEKGTETKIEVQTTEVVVNADDEKFEWYEVWRGKGHDSSSPVGSNWISGVKDPQVWMTAISYMGIIISLYSFSLFL